MTALGWDFQKALLGLGNQIPMAFKRICTPKSLRYSCKCHPLSFVKVNSPFILFCVNRKGKEMETWERSERYYFPKMRKRVLVFSTMLRRRAQEATVLGGDGEKSSSDEKYQRPRDTAGNNGAVISLSHTPFAYVSGNVFIPRMSCIGRLYGNAAGKLGGQWAKA